MPMHSLKAVASCINHTFFKSNKMNRNAKNSYAKNSYAKNNYDNSNYDNNRCSYSSYSNNRCSISNKIVEAGFITTQGTL